MPTGLLVEDSMSMSLCSGGIMSLPQSREENVAQSPNIRQAGQSYEQSPSRPRSKRPKLDAAQQV